jgi:amidase
MHEDDLCYLTVREALHQFSGGALSPVELIDAVLRRIERVNPRINALADRYFDEARAEAKRAERRWRDGTARRLEGIPLAVKDAQNMAGRRTTYGSPAYRSNIAALSDPIIERLLAAGAIVHSRTTVSEFCLSGVCQSALWGTTRNPWNPDYSPGGSSGGSAAALAAGMTLLASGTDMGGSIRVPASACGVVGYKPPHGRNPDGPPANLDRLNHCGVLARSVGDIALVQNVIAGQHSRDHDSLPDPPSYPDGAQDISGLRIAWSPDLSYRAADPEVIANSRQALSVLEDLGCIVTACALDWSEEVDRIAADWYRQGHFGTMLLEIARTHPDVLSTDLRRLAAVWQDEGKGVTHVLDLIGRMSRSFTELMQSHDVFICPTMSVPAVRADQSMWDETFEIDGRRVDPEFGYSMTHQFNLLGHCPAMSLPSGRSSAGLPTGLQIVGKPFDEQTVFQTALAFEAAAGPWFAAPASRPLL